MDEDGEGKTAEVADILDVKEVAEKEPIDVGEEEFGAEALENAEEFGEGEDEEFSLEEEEEEEEPAPKSESVVRLRSEASIGDTRIQWESADLLCLNVACDPDILIPQCKYEPDDNQFNICLDLALIKGEISLTERNLLAEKFDLFVGGYRKLQKNIKELNNDNLLCRDTLIDHGKIDDWFESLPLTYEVEEKTKKTKEKFFDVVQNRMQLLAYRNKLVVGEMEASKYDREIKGMENDLKLTLQIIASYSEEGNIPRKKMKEQIKALMENIEDLKFDIIDEDEKYQKVDLHTKGESKKYEVLFKNLSKLEEDSDHMRTLMKRNKEDIEDNLGEAFNLRQKQAALKTKLENGNQENQDLVKQIAKLERQEKKESANSLSLRKQLSAKGNSLNEWESKLSQTIIEYTQKKENMQMLQSKMKAMNQEFCILYQRRTSLKKMVNKYRREVRIQNGQIIPLREAIKDKKHLQGKLKEQAESYAVDPEQTAMERQTAEKEIDKLGKQALEHFKQGKEEEIYYKKLLNHVKELQVAQWNLRKDIHQLIQEISLHNRILQKEQRENQLISIDLKFFVDKLSILEQEKITNQKLLELKKRQFEEFDKKYVVEKVERAGDALRKVKLINEVKEWKIRMKMNDADSEKFNLLQRLAVEKFDHVRATLKAEAISYAEDLHALRDLKGEVRKRKFEEECRREALMNTKSNIYKAQVKGESTINRLLKACLDRNHKALKLRDQLEEEIFYQESINIYGNMLKAADAEFETRGQVIHKLKLIEREEQQKKYIAQRNLRKSEELLRQLEDVAERIEVITQEQLELEKKYNGDRHQLVRLKQMESRKEAERKVITLEDLVTKQEAKVTELKMVEEYIKRTLPTLEEEKKKKSSIIIQSVSSNLQLQKKTVNQQDKLKTKAVELAYMKTQAESLKEKSILEKKKYSDALKNFQNGLPPTLEMQREWEKENLKGNVTISNGNKNKTDDEKIIDQFDGPKPMKNRIKSSKKSGSSRCTTALNKNVRKPP